MLFTSIEAPELFLLPLLLWCHRFSSFTLPERGEDGHISTAVVPLFCCTTEKESVLLLLDCFC